MRNFFLPSLFWIAAVIFFASCGPVKEPELKGIENIRVGRVGLKESSLRLDLNYFNPNKYRLKLKKAEGDAWLDDHPLGHFTIDTLIHISPHAEFRLPVRLKLDMSFLLQNASAALSGKEVIIKVNGVARIGKGFVFINYPIHYEGKQNPAELVK